MRLERFEVGGIIAGALPRLPADVDEGQITVACQVAQLARGNAEFGGGLGGGEQSGHQFTFASGICAKKWFSVSA